VLLGAEADVDGDPHVVLPGLAQDAGQVLGALEQGDEVLQAGDERPGLALVEGFDPDLGVEGHRYLPRWVGVGKVRAGWAQWEGIAGRRA
jgi:hypothetical protein